LVAAASRRLMAEWECLLVAKASVDQQRMRVSVGIQWTMRDQKLQHLTIRI